MKNTLGKYPEPPLALISAPYVPHVVSIGGGMIATRREDGSVYILSDSQEVINIISRSEAALFANWLLMTEFKCVGGAL